MRLVLAMSLLAGACNQPAECEEDENVRADFSLSPEAPRESSSWVEEPCTIAGVVRGTHTLVCDGLVDKIGSDTVNLFVFTAPEMTSPLRSGDSVTFTHHDESSIRFEQYFLLRKNGSLAIAGQRADSLGPRHRIILADFYHPVGVEVAVRACSSRGGDCGKRTRIGLSFWGQDVFDHQFRTTSEGSGWVEIASRLDDNGSCEDTANFHYDFIIIASP